MDHLFKFHRHGFSYRNIENAPELIEINKTPELRSFITTIIQYLSQVHIQKMNSGLHDFRFNKRISHEISYLSKVSEDASAAFNFTLDESQSIKLFYHRTLKRLLDKYKNFASIDKPEDFVRSIAVIHMILGDLHFYDDEFNEAIIEYQDAVQFIRGLDPNKLSISLMVLIIRNLLKLGLSYEKRKTYDSAFLVFAELSDILVSFRNIDLDKLGLEEYEKNQKLTLRKSSNADLEETFFKEMNPSRDSKMKLSISQENFIAQLVNNLTPQKESILNKIATFEGLKLIYQPILAKLQILEKTHLGGITTTDLNRLEAEYGFMLKAIVQKDKAIMSSEFYNKIGNILYYKNGKLTEHKDVRNHKLYAKCKGYSDLNLTKNDCNLACSSCCFYTKALGLHIEHIAYGGNSSIKRKDRISDFIELLLEIRFENNFKKNDIDSFRILASVLSNLADVIFSCSSQKERIDPRFHRYFLDLIDSEIENGDVSISYEKLGKFVGKKMHDLLILCYLSSYFYKKADEYKYATWQYTKILYILNAYFKINPASIKHFEISSSGISGDENDSSIESKILSKIIRDTHGAYENIHITEIERFKFIFNKTEMNKNISLHRLTINADLIEPLTIFNHLKLRAESAEYKNVVGLITCRLKLVLDFYFNKNVSSPYMSYLTIYNKIMKLRFKVTINTKLFKELINPNLDFYTEYPSNKKDFDLKLHNKFRNKIELNNLFDEFWPLQGPQFSRHDNSNRGLFFIAHLICDSIYCLNEIVKSMNTYGKSYILSSSYQAMIHESLAEWSHYYKLIYFGLPSEKFKYPINIREDLASLIGTENLIFVNPNYQCEMAHNLYYSSIETHSEGRAYHYLIEDMSFLNEDFNDNTYHFFASLERFKINTGQIKFKIEYLSRMFKTSAIYKSEYYNEIKKQ